MWKFNWLRPRRKRRLWGRDSRKLMETWRGRMNNWPSRWPLISSKVDRSKVYRRRLMVSQTINLSWLKNLDSRPVHT